MDAATKPIEAKDIARAEKSARYLMTLIESLAAVLPALADVGGYAKVVRGFEFKAEELKREEDQAKQRIEIANTEATKIRQLAASKTSEAERQAAEIIAKAGESAAGAVQVVADAEARAAAIVAAAKLSSDDLIAEAAGRLEVVEGNIAAAAIRAASATTSAEAAEARLAELNAEITRMKAKFG